MLLSFQPFGVSKSVVGQPRAGSAAQSRWAQPGTTFVLEFWHTRVTPAVGKAPLALHGAAQRLGCCSPLRTRTPIPCEGFCAAAPKVPPGYPLRALALSARLAPRPAL